MEVLLAGIGWGLGFIGLGIMWSIDPIVKAWERVQLAKYGKVDDDD